MAIQSWGYINEITPGEDYSLAATYAWGTRYWCYNQDAVRVTPLIGGTREVQISTGQFGTYGIRNLNNSVATVQLPAPVSAGTQWYLVVARHTWADEESATTFVALHCGSIAQLPAGRRSDPGDVVDLPLAYVPITFGQSNPGTPIDMRAMGTGKDDVLINSEYALAYLAVAGMRCRLGNKEYSRVLIGGGSGHGWLIHPGPWGKVTNLPITTGNFGSLAGGWSWHADSRAKRYGNMVHLTIRLRRTGANIQVGSSGGIIDARLFRVNAEWKPDEVVEESCSYINQGQGNSAGIVRIDKLGDVYISAGTANQDIRQMPAGSWSISTNFRFIQES